MRIYVAPAGVGDASVAARNLLLRLAASDTTRRHRLASDPADADAILVVGIGDGDDLFLSRLRSGPLVRNFRRKIVVYDERDQPLFSFPGFYPSATRSWASRHQGQLLGAPYLRAVGLPRDRDHAVDRDLLFAFRGALTHPLRDAVIRLRHPAAVVDSTERFGTGGRGIYADLLRRSRFVLCPRGFGHSSIRIYEALAAGAVPVVISDDWLSPPGEEWDRAVIRVAEADVDAIPELLERLDQEWPALAEAAGRAAALLRRDAFWNHLGDWVSLLSHGRFSPWWWDRRTIRTSVRVFVRKRNRRWNV